jgi:histidine triad (HIT) family protein
MDDCVFCKVVKGEIPMKRICESDNFITIPDIRPICEGHSLIISKKHFKTSLDIPSSLGVELLDCIKETSIKLMKEHNATGFNIIQNNFESAGQAVNHIHFHIMPRKKGGKSPLTEIK